MSANKMFFGLFVLFFGANVVGIVYFGKNKPLEEAKTIWLYELPKTPAPWDGMVSLEYGPTQALVGTLALPGSSKNQVGYYLAQSIRGAGTESAAGGGASGADKSSAAKNETEVLIPAGLTFTNGHPITAESFIQSRDLILAQVQALGYALKDIPLVIRPFYGATLSSTAATVSAGVEKGSTVLTIRWNEVPTDVFQTLSHPWTGAVHPSNISPGLAVKDPKEWVSSSAYRVRKWRPKEKVLASRNDFKPGLPITLFRTLKFLTAPVKNPSAAVLPAAFGEIPLEKSFIPRNRPMGFYQILWICRSWSQAGRPCAERLQTSSVKAAPDLLPSRPGEELVTRIADGAEKFRGEFRNALGVKWTAAGGKFTANSSVFSKPEDADLEYLFLHTISNSVEESRFFAGFSSRLRSADGRLPTREQMLRLSDRVHSFQADDQLKEATGDPFLKVVLAQ